MPDMGPMVTRRRLRIELRRLREERGQSLEDVATEMEWSNSKLIRIESGDVSISVSDLKVLLGHYGVTEPERVAAILDLARTARQRTWWSAYQNRLSKEYRKFIQYEAEADRIWHFQPLIISGILQTRAYAKAIVFGLATGDLSEADAEAPVEIRIGRQNHVLARAEPPEIVAVIDEPVLHRPVGGRKTMREQLDHLIEASAWPNMTVIILPLSVGAHPGLVGAFSILEFDDPQDPDVLFLETAANDVIVRDQPQETANFRRAFERFRRIGAQGSDAVDLIKAARANFS
jgi:transcriptional regulator with XRE-family HTH domain